MSANDQDGNALRVLGWIAAIVALALVLWFGSAALVRERSRERIDAEIARIRAAGEPTTSADAWGPEPRPEENGTPLLQAVERGLQLADGLGPDSLAPVFDWLNSPSGRAECGVSWNGDREQVEPWIFSALQPGATESPESTAAYPPCAPALRRVWLGAHAKTLEAARAAADRGALWFPGYGIGSLLNLRACTRLLALAARSAVDEGDGASAVADLRRALVLGRALERQPSLANCMLRQVVQEMVLATLRQLVSSIPLPPELALLDTELERARTWSMLSPALVVERTWIVESYAFKSPGTWSGISGWKAWLRPDLDARTWRAFADTLESIRTEIELTKLEPRDCLSDPAWSELRSRFAGGHTGLFGAPEAASLLAASLARHDVDLSLARAALRARFEGFDGAHAFLAGQTDPFTGASLSAMLEPDGSILLGSVDEPADGAPAERPGEARSRAWHIRK